MKDPAAHTYDGIAESQNKLPRWWLASLYGAIAFAFGYWFYFQVFQLGETPGASLRREQAEIAAREGKGVAITGGMLADLAHDRAAVDEGKKVFASTCAPCHGENAGGKVGPNLTDEYWLHGGLPEQIYATVKNGQAVKGMPAWGPQLGDTRVAAVVAYVLSIKNTHVPGGKEPQGQLAALEGTSAP
jgi:cytochrome c oxidase cbb3-type subunit 3